MSNQYGPRIVTNGLVLCLDAGNPKSYPGSGTTWNDLSGNNNHGTLINGPSFSNEIGGSLIFDGINDYVSFNTITVNTNTGFTFDTWIYINDPQPIYAGFWAYWYSINDTHFEWGTWPGPGGFQQGIFVYKDNGAPGGPSVTSPYIGNTWANLVFGCNQRMPFMYVNAQYIGSSTAFRNTNVNITNLLRRQTFSDRYFRARHSSIKLFNRALSPDEILINFNAIKGRFL